MADSKNPPSWYVPEQPDAPAAANAAPPSWYSPEAPEPAAPAEPVDYGAAKNFLTGLLRVPGAVLGLPHLLAHTKNWLDAQSNNAVSAGVAALGGKGLPHQTGADLDKMDPIAQMTPSSEGIDKAVFGATGVTPYQPTSPLGQIGQAAVTAGGAGALDPAADIGLIQRLAQAGKLALSGGAAQGTQQLFPDTPGLAALTAFLTHAGTTAAGKAAKAGYRTLAEPFVDPRGAGEALAGKELAPVDNQQPGMAAPTGLDLSNAADQTRLAVDDIGSGQDDYTAGGNIRSDLQGRKDSLEAGRTATANQNYDAFRAEQPLEGAKLAPFMQAPAFRAAVKAASDGSLNRLEKPLTDFWDFNEAGDPKLRPNAAVPPDVLQRIKGALSDAVAGAKGNVARGDLTSLQNKFVNFLDTEYPNTYPKSRDEFAAQSRPLDPLETGPAGRVLNSETSFGNRTYSVPQDKIANTFLGSKALRSDFDNLVAGYGGDKTAALANLQDNLAGKVQGAIKGDGTLSLDAFNRSIRPYTGALKMWFPDLAQKFSSAEAAQKTFETLQAQKGLVDDISSGALRNSDGIVTRGSAQKWLSQNADALGKTQAKGAIMRLQQIAGALPEAPGAGAEAAVEAAPMVAGGLAGGLEGGVLGGITHKIPAALAGPRLAAFKDHYSNAVEKAFTDPVEAQRLITLAGKRGSKPIGRLIAYEATHAALAAPIAVNASKSVAPQ